MTSLYTARHYCLPDAMSAAAAYVDCEYGPYGYRLGVALETGACTVFDVRHFDGSCFNIVADKWGNVVRIADGVDRTTAEEVIRQAHRQAVAS